MDLLKGHFLPPKGAFWKDIFWRTNQAPNVDSYRILWKDLEDHQMWILRGYFFGDFLRNKQVTNHGFLSDIFQRTKAFQNGNFWLYIVRGRIFWIEFKGHIWSFKGSPKVVFDRIFFEGPTKCGLLKDIFWRTLKTTKCEYFKDIFRGIFKDIFKGPTDNQSNIFKGYISKDQGITKWDFWIFIFWGRIFFSKESETIKCEFHRTKRTTNVRFEEIF